MKALTVIQPWASLIAAGIKRVENRRWTTNYRGPLLIHAGANRTAYPPDSRVPDAPFSMIVARCELVDVVRSHNPGSRTDWLYMNACKALGDDLNLHCQQREFIEGPYCWILANIQPLAIPFARGEQGLFDIDLDAAIANGPAVAAMLAERNKPKAKRLTKAELQAQADAALLAEWNRRHADGRQDEARERGGMEGHDRPNPDASAVNAEGQATSGKDAGGLGLGESGQGSQ